MFSSIIASTVLERAGKLVNAGKMSSGKELFKALEKFAKGDEKKYIDHYLKVVDYIETHPYLITLMPQEFLVSTDMVGLIADVLYEPVGGRAYPKANTYLAIMKKLHPMAIEYITSIFELSVEAVVDNPIVLEKIEIPLADKTIEFDVKSVIAQPTVVDRPTKKGRR